MTQSTLILAMLRDAGERGIHSFELLEAHMPRAAARVSELRAQGFDITAEHERFRGEAHGVRYRLHERQPAPPPVAADSPLAALFEQPAQSRPHYDEVA